MKDKHGEFTGFTVYDAKTGNPVLKTYHGKPYTFLLSEEGDLWVYSLNGIFDLPKNGRYIIQLGTGEKYKY